MMSLWFDLNSTSKTLNLSFLQFFERSGFQNYVCKWQCHRQSLPTWCPIWSLKTLSLLEYMSLVKQIGEQIMESDHNFSFLCFSWKKYMEKWFLFPKFGRLWLVMIIESWSCLVVDDKCMNVFRKWVINVFRVWQDSCQLELVCVFKKKKFYFTLCYWNGCYVVGIAYIHKL